MSVAPIQQRPICLNPSQGRSNAQLQLSNAQDLEKPMVAFEQVYDGREFFEATGMELYRVGTTEFRIYRSELIPNQRRDQFLRKETAITYFEDYHKASHKLTISYDQDVPFQFEDCKYGCCLAEFDESLKDNNGWVYSNNATVFIVNDSNLYVFDKRDINDPVIIPLKSVTIRWLNYSYQSFETIEQFQMVSEMTNHLHVSYADCLKCIRSSLESNANSRSCVMKPFRSEHELILYQQNRSDENRMITPLFMFYDREMTHEEAKIMDDSFLSYSQCDQLKLEIPQKYLTEENGEYLLKLLKLIECLFGQILEGDQIQSLASKHIELVLMDDNGEEINQKTSIALIKHYLLSNRIHEKGVLNYLICKFETKPLPLMQTEPTSVNLSQIYRPLQVSSKKNPGMNSIFPSQYSRIQVHQHKIKKIKDDIFIAKVKRIAAQMKIETLEAELFDIKQENSNALKRGVSIPHIRQEQMRLNHDLNKIKDDYAKSNETVNRLSKKHVNRLCELFALKLLYQSGLWNYKKKIDSLQVLARQKRRLIWNKWSSFLLSKDAQYDQRYRFELENYQHYVQRLLKLINIRCFILRHRVVQTVNDNKKESLCDKYFDMQYQIKVLKGVMEEYDLS